MVDLLDGTPCPPATGANANATGATAWTMLNSKLYSILFFATEGSANITVKQFQARPQARQKADGFAWAMMGSGGLLLLAHIVPLVVLVILFGLELAVAMIQAYVFTILSCIYINDAIVLH